MNNNQVVILTEMMKGFIQVLTVVLKCVNLYKHACISKTNHANVASCTNNETVENGLELVYPRCYVVCVYLDHKNPPPDSSQSNFLNAVKIFHSMELKGKKCV